MLSLLSIIALTVLTPLQPAAVEPNPPGVIRPYPGGQTNYLSRPEFEVLFGGAAGPGKSFMLVLDGLGLQYKTSPLGMAAYEHPKYRGIIFRRQSNQLSELIDMGHEIYSPFGGVYRAHKRGDPGPSFTFPAGSKIFLGYMEAEKDKFNFQGLPFQFFAFDELTQFLLSQYIFLFSRARTTVEHMPVRFRSSTNPIGAGLWWVRHRFPIEHPYKSFAFLPAADPAKNPRGIQVAHGTAKSKTRAFVPGYLAENPSIQEGYVESIEQMGALYVEALLKNNWNAFSGDFFPWKQEMEVAPFMIPENWRLVGGLDPGWSSPCSFGLKAISPEGEVFRVMTYYERNRSSAQHAKGVLAALKACKLTGGRLPDLIVAGADAFAHKDRYAIVSNESTMEAEFRSVGLILHPAETSRKVGWFRTKSLMQDGKYFVFLGLNNPYVNEVTAAVADDGDPEELSGGGNDKDVMDHALDEDRYSNMAIWTPDAPTKTATGWRARLQAKKKTGGGFKIGDA